jgi:hypothetical protein
VAPCQKPSGSPYICSLHNGHCLKLQSIYPILPVIVVKWNGQIWSHIAFLWISFEKIKSYGIPVVGPTLNWIEDFLKNRTQKVMVNGAGSEWENATSGIPQGSVLAPILFVIYIYKWSTRHCWIGLVSQLWPLYLFLGLLSQYLVQVIYMYWFLRFYFC